MTSPHRIVNPAELVSPNGFSHAVVAEEGRTVWIAGQIAVDDEGLVQGETFAEQFELALGNVVTALHAAGADPEHVVAMTIYTTSMDGYRSSLGELGPIWREHMGRNYPAMAMLGTTELVEPRAMLEILAVAVIPPGL